MSVFATPVEEQQIQQRINDIGYNILNSNQINNRIVFIYSENEKQNIKIQRKEEKTHE